MRSILLVSILFLIACNPVNVPNVETESAVPPLEPAFGPGERQLVYKTRANYDSLVPVILSADKKEIVSFPEISAIRDSSTFPIPGKLHKGYLLDNAGVWKDVGFLKLSYREYAQMDSNPSAKDLYKQLIDKEPLLEMCDCGNKSLIKNPELQINQLIDADRLEKVCRSLMIAKEAQQ